MAGTSNEDPLTELFIGAFDLDSLGQYSIQANGLF